MPQCEGGAAWGEAKFNPALRSRDNSARNKWRLAPNETGAYPMYALVTFATEVQAHGAAALLDGKRIQVLLLLLLLYLAQEPSRKSICSAKLFAPVAPSSARSVCDPRNPTAPGTTQHILKQAHAPQCV